MGLCSRKQITITNSELQLLNEYLTGYTSKYSLSSSLSLGFTDKISAIAYVLIILIGEEQFKEGRCYYNRTDV